MKPLVATVAWDKWPSEKYHPFFVPWQSAGTVDWNLLLLHDSSPPQSPLSLCKGKWQELSEMKNIDAPACSGGDLAQHIEPGRKQLQRGYSQVNIKLDVKSLVCKMTARKSCLCHASWEAVIDHMSSWHLRHTPSDFCRCWPPGQCWFVASIYSYLYF